jgi:pimeloyl-ACP methyl ester carboxylesterase
VSHHLRRLIAVPAFAVALWLFGPTATPAPATPLGPPVSIGGRQFLEYDPRGDGRAVEAIGDLDTATRVAIIVPGVDNRLANFDRGVGRVARRAPSFQARQLYAELRILAPDEPVAVVAWLGYDPPEGVGRDAIREDRAAAGAVALKSFVDNLVTGNPDVAITVIGHSYGSVVAGLAAPEFPPQVGNLVAIGSPGNGRRPRRRPRHHGAGLRRHRTARLDPPAARPAHPRRRARHPAHRPLLRRAAAAGRRGRRP